MSSSSRSTVCVFILSSCYWRTWPPLPPAGRWWSCGCFSSPRLDRGGLTSYPPLRQKLKVNGVCARELRPAFAQRVTCSTAASSVHSLPGSGFPVRGSCFQRCRHNAATSSASAMRGPQRAAPRRNARRTATHRTAMSHTNQRRTISSAPPTRPIFLGGISRKPEDYFRAEARRSPPSQ